MKGIVVCCRTFYKLINATIYLYFPYSKNKLLHCWTWLKYLNKNLHGSSLILLQSSPMGKAQLKSMRKIQPAGISWRYVDPPQGCEMNSNSNQPHTIIKPSCWLRKCKCFQLQRQKLKFILINTICIFISQGLLHYLAILVFELMLETVTLWQWSE